MKLLPSPLQSFPLHDPASLSTLKQKLYFHLPVFSSSRGLPIGEIRDYFGEMIAIYFAFLRYFAAALLPVVFVAIPYYFLGGRKDFEAFFFFAIYNMIWATLLMEFWKRKSARLAFKWGTLSLQGAVHEEPRAGLRVKTVHLNLQ